MLWGSDPDPHIRTQLNHIPTLLSEPQLTPASKVPDWQSHGWHPFEESGPLLPKPEAQGRELQKQVGHVGRELVPTSDFFTY